MEDLKDAGARWPGITRNNRTEHRTGGHLTGEEQELLEKYLTHLNMLGPEEFYPNFEAWYQEIRYAQGPSTPQTVAETAELRYKGVLEAAKLFKA